MNKKTRNILIVAIPIVIVFVIISAIFVNNYMHRRAELIKKLTRVTRLVDIVFAKKDISKGAVITPDMVELSLIPAQLLQSSDLTSLDSVIGKKASEYIYIKINVLVRSR